jgi:hypothetical protein
MNSAFYTHRYAIVLPDYPQNQSVEIAFEGN